MSRRTLSVVGRSPFGAGAEGKRQSNTHSDPYGDILQGKANRDTYEDSSDKPIASVHAASVLK
ncbi:hypothetical protein GCM10023264_10950 [Sphingomonas daechungensis]